MGYGVLLLDEIGDAVLQILVLNGNEIPGLGVASRVRPASGFNNFVDEISGIDSGLNLRMLLLFWTRVKILLVYRAPFFGLMSALYAITIV